MGAFNSLHSRLQDFSDANEEHLDQATTPEKIFKHKCVIGVDPRSPSDDINRTPIIVDGTPHIKTYKAIKTQIPSHVQATSGPHDPRSPSDVINRTPIIVDGTPHIKISKAFKTQIPSHVQATSGPYDPRSPSAEFTRTPLNFGKSSAINLDTPLKAPVEITSCPTSEQDNSNAVQPESKEGKLCDILDQSASSSDQVLSSDESLEISFDTVPLLESTRKFDLSTNYIPKKSVSPEQETEAEDSFSSQGILRCRQVNRILGHQTSSPAKGRSPLTIVDNHTPISHVPKKRRGGKTDPNHITSSIIDKENVCH